jgi:hypothetical protein
VPGGIVRSSRRSSADCSIALSGKRASGAATNQTLPWRDRRRSQFPPPINPSFQHRGGAVHGSH